MIFRKLPILIFMITSFNSTAQIDQEMTIYKFKVTNLEGDIFDFNSLKGKKI